MRSLYNTRFGGTDVLQVREEPDPIPREGEVLIRAERSGLNFADIMARVGLYPDAPKPPMVMGYEVAGTVAAVGSGVTAPKIGDRVIALTHFKGQSDRVIAPAWQALPMPAGMTFDAGAALPVNYLTALHMMFHVGQLRPGDRILIHMAAGGVGLAAIQLAKQVENVTIFGTASASKHAMLKEAGVHHPIDYRTVDYAAEIRRITGGKGVHMVLDALGGNDWNKGYKLLAPAGHLIAFGWANMVSGERRNVFKVGKEYLSMKSYSPATLMNHNHTVSGVNMGSLWGEADLMTSHMRRLLELFQQKKISPHVDKVFPLSKAGEAHQYVQARKNVGKVLFDCAA
jgi:synaptic vesicle membrane protein VAT-1